MISKKQGRELVQFFSRMGLSDFLTVEKGSVELAIPNERMMEFKTKWALGAARMGDPTLSFDDLFRGANDEKHPKSEH